MAEVALALGSNLGDSARILQGAVDALNALDGLRLRGVSAVFETDPVGGPEQPRYLNAVVVGDTDLAPLDLLDATQEVEQSFHRVRDIRWGPRTLDIDILAMGELALDTERLTVPHPRAHERGFVLVPWADIDPDGIVAGRGTVIDLRDQVATEGVRPTDVRLVLGSGS